MKDNKNKMIISHRQLCNFVNYINKTAYYKRCMVK